MDTLAKYLGEPAVRPSLAGGLDYAFGGATVAYQNQPPPFNAFPRVSQQVGQYLAAHAPAANDLIVVWGGANDFIESFSSPTGPINPILSADTLESSLETLATAGGRQFVVPNLPALGETPFIRGLGIPGLSAAADQWTAAFDAELAADIGTFKSGHPDATVVSLDVAGLFQQATQPSNPFGFVNTTDGVGPLVPGSPFLAAVTATDPQDYLFFDGVHPTSKGHQLVGVEAAAAVYDALGFHDLVVTSTADTVDPTASGLSLREMVNLSNAMHGQQTITFDLGPGPHQINLNGKDLPITRDVVVRGPGAEKLTISGNAASRVFDISGGPTVTIARLTIADGLVQGDVQGGGGGILNENGATLNLREMVFSGNVASPAAIFTAVGPGAGGGGILNQSGATLHISGSTFTGNQAVGGLGGGVWDQVGSTATVTDSVFSNNQAVGVLDVFFPGLTAAEGGGVDNDGTLTLSNSTFVNNQAIGGSAGVQSFGTGGGIANEGTLTVTASSFTGNQALGGTVSNGITIFSQGVGGGIANIHSLTVSDSTFTDNQAIGGSGATSLPSINAFIGVGGGIMNLVSATVSVRSSTITGNQAIGGDGGSGGPGSFGYGGGIEVEAGSTLTLSDSSFSHNAAIGGAGGSGAPGGDGVGGGMAVGFGSTATITNITVTHNQALGGDGGSGANGGNGVGGGIIVGGNEFFYGSPDTSSVTLSGSTLTGNVAQGGEGRSGGNGGNGLGGGLFADSGTTATISNSELDHNRAVGGDCEDGGNSGNGFGGDIYVASGATVSLTGCTVTHNRAQGGEGDDGGSDGQGIGGGVYNLGTFTFDVTTVIAHNHASTSNDDIFP